ncbi:MAG: hypothetical protein L0220_02810 [Acidobacteria bacterium]|nr:hypothetical protein [Acidobacteriota bacterium]
MTPNTSTDKPGDFITLYSGRPIPGEVFEREKAKRLEGGWGEAVVILIILAAALIGWKLAAVIVGVMIFGWLILKVEELFRWWNPVPKGEKQKCEIAKK